MKYNKLDYSDYYENGGNVDKTIPLKFRRELYDKDGERRIDEKAIEVLTHYAENLPQTKDLNTSKKTGDYYPERQKLHRKIMDSFKKDLICIQNDEPIAILMGGSPASGKSTFLRKYAPYLLKEEILKVDADEIRAKLPEYKGWNATSTHQETKDIVNTLLSDRTIGIPCKYDIIYDGTMNSTKSYYPLIALLKKLGYKIFIVYIDKVDEEVVKRRALERYKKSGRFVPAAVIDDFFTRGKSALNELKDKADGYMIVDGSGGDYKVIERGGMKLPKRRAYSKLGVPIAELEKTSKMESGGDVFMLNAKNPKSISGRGLTPLPKGNYSSNRSAMNSDKKLLAPNGKPSNLNATQYELVRTSAFKKWFGDWEKDPANASKVIDDNGEPLVCFRGQKIQRTQGKERKSNTYGIYYSANRDSVRIYGNLVTTSFINLKNPLILKDTKWNLSLISKYIYDSLIEKGYDGAIWERKNEFYEIVAFESNQIKLADGTNTIFDSTSDDIRFAKGGKVKGDCYQVAGQMVVGVVNKEIDYKGTPYLVHAEVKHSKIKGLRFGHAFIEDNENVYDFSNNREIIIPKELYYYFGDINPKDKSKYRKYTFREATKKMNDTGNYGCWDIDVEFNNGGEIVKSYKREIPDYLKMFLGR